MAMHQAAMYMLRHPSRYYRFMEEDLLFTGESYESFVYNVFHCNVWGDDLIAAVFGDMWNIAISIVSPTAKKTVPFIPQQKSTRCCVSMQWTQLHESRRSHSLLCYTK